MIKTLNVNLIHHKYPIYIGENLLNNSECFSNHISAQQKVLIVTNTTVSALYADNLRLLLSNITPHIQIAELPDGEKYKSWQYLDIIFTKLLEHDFDRQSIIIALGGGVVGDMAGFAAASFMRGIKFIQVPTTLLSQVDSSVGGKTGINHSLGKNMIGAFCQPQAVIADIATLKTLPKRELSAGIAEIIKHACIADVNFLDWLEQNIDKMLNLDMQALIESIYTSCKIKADFVQKDEKEQSIRAYLNFGHTFGHAIETAMGYGVWLHGEAVGCGMVIASHLSSLMGFIDEAQKNRIINLIKKSGLPITSPKISVSEYIQNMNKDKKNNGGNIQFILLNGLGNAQKTTADIELVKKVLLENGAV